jgi:hypothetical protein
VESIPRSESLTDVWSSQLSHVSAMSGQPIVCSLHAQVGRPVTVADLQVASDCRLALCAIEQFLEACGIDAGSATGQSDPGLTVASDVRASVNDFIATIAKHRQLAKETDPPRVRGTSYVRSSRFWFESFQASSSSANS